MGISINYWTVFAAGVVNMASAGSGKAAEITVLTNMGVV